MGQGCTKYKCFNHNYIEKCSASVIWKSCSAQSPLRPATVQLVCWLICSPTSETDRSDCQSIHNQNAHAEHGGIARCQVPVDFATRIKHHHTKCKRNNIQSARGNQSSIDAFTIPVAIGNRDGAMIRHKVPAKHVRPLTLPQSTSRPEPMDTGIKLAAKNAFAPSRSATQSSTTKSTSLR